MKALITTAALGIGLGALALAATVQQHPYAFQKQRQVAFAGSLALVDQSTHRLVAPPPEPEPALKPVKKKRPQRMQRVAAKTAPELDVKILPAPCRHGEYRKLEPTRGVWLMCPGQL